MTSTSPAFPLSSLTLKVANREQSIESRKRSYHEWGRGLSLEKYLERDEQTEQHEIGRDGKLVTWVLVRRDTPEDLTFLCACETFKREGAVSDRKSGVFKTVPCYGIASVFTPAENRKKGYAAHMMRLLHWMLAPRSSLPKEFPIEWGTPPQRDDNIVGDAAFSVLYSDIGSNFYRLSGTAPGREDGWVVRSPQSTVWKVNEFQKKDNKGTEESQWTWLDEESLSKVWEADTEMMKSELASYPLSNGQHVACTFFPRGGVADFQIQRRREFWANMKAIPGYFGLCKSSSNSESSVDLSTFAAWTIEYGPPKINTLLVMRLRVSPSSFEDLIQQLVGYAERHFIERVEIWNLDPRLHELAHNLGGQTFYREDHLCSLKWYGSEDAEEVEWAFNEKFPWC